MPTIDYIKRANDGFTCSAVRTHNSADKDFGRTLTKVGAQLQPGQVDAGLACQSIAHNCR